MRVTFTGTMVLVGMVIGFLFFSPYAIPQQVPSEAEADTAGALAFQGACTTCHGVDRVENYQGNQSWEEIIQLMRDFGAFITEEEAKEIQQYLESTYPR
ncbi:c-type cytochrome [Thermanaeromonas sp. C210]|uniref:c-type cytochrome n=1 Tax=Thermanaeromonas sp. C210 TaxID=2731925 RepID=UPI001C259B49|nr:cytochrome c [Thermanaeromonas sp. C210]